MINQIREEQPPLNLIRPPQLGGFQGPRIAESIINQQPGGVGGGIQNTRQYWNEKEQNWLRLSVNLNPLAFANYELFKSANMDISESPNPVQCVLCFILKFIILILYFLTPYYQTMTLYETIVLLGGVDFWVIKNISGRKTIALSFNFSAEGKLKVINSNTRLQDKIFCQNLSLCFSIILQISNSVIENKVQTKLF